MLGCLGEGRGRVTRVMLDNMVTASPDGGVNTDMLRTAVKLIDGRCETEVGGKQFSAWESSRGWLLPLFMLLMRRS